MALTLGSGPFGKQSTGKFNFEVTAPRGHILYLEDSPKRVRAVFNGETVVDSRRVKLLHETSHLPVYYFPEEDIREDLLEPTDHTTHCPFKGDASYRSIRAGDRTAENVVWHYPEPGEHFAPLAGYAAFYYEKMDTWYEEDEEVFGHPHDPYHRVDVLESSRHVKVTVDGEVVAETQRPKLLFETGLPVRYYIPPEDVRTDLLVPSETHTVCPYKGVASYKSVSTGDELLEDLAWYYPEPLPEAVKVRDHLCFHGEKVETEVNG
ncbi:MAG: DUF427 domain-containing protein [Rubrobacteraceae bacterium]